MFGINFGELLVIAVVAFLLFDPKDIPAKIKQFYAIMGKLRKYAAEAQTGLQKLTVDMEEHVQPLSAAAHSLLQGTQPVSTPVTRSAESVASKTIDEGFLQDHGSAYAKEPLDMDEFIELKNQSRGDYASHPMPLPGENRPQS